MKRKLLTSLIFIILVISFLNISHLRSELQNLKKENEKLEEKIAKLQETNNDLSESLNKEMEENKVLSNQLEQREKGVRYIDTIVEGKETFTTYENLVKNFGNPKEIRKIIDENDIYNHGHFAILIYDDIEFVINCSGNGENPFLIKNHDRVCRVDITGDRYKLDRYYFSGIKVGDSAREIAKHYNKEIHEINYEGRSDMDIVVKSLRGDIEEFKCEKGIYFSGEMDTGLALGIVLLINDDGKVDRIVMGWPTAG